MTISLVYTRKWGSADLDATKGSHPASAPQVAGAASYSEEVDETDDESTAVTEPHLVFIPGAAAAYFMWIGVDPALTTTSYQEVAAGASGQWRWLDTGESIVFSDTRPT